MYQNWIILNLLQILLENIRLGNNFKEKTIFYLTSLNIITDDFLHVQFSYGLNNEFSRAETGVFEKTFNGIEFVVRGIFVS